VHTGVFATGLNFAELQTAATEGAAPATPVRAAGALATTNANCFFCQG
jgi:hypothetical protein